MLEMVDKMEKEVDYQKKTSNKVIKENKQLRVEIQELWDLIDGENSPDLLKGWVSELSNKCTEKSRQNQDMKNLIK